VRLPGAPTRRGAMGFVGIGDRLYAAGGYTQTNFSLRVLEIYDIEDRSWHVGPQMPTGRNHVGAAVLDRRMVVTGGRPGGPNGGLATVEAYDPRRDRWSVMARSRPPAAATPRSSSTANSSSSAARSSARAGRRSSRSRSSGRRASGRRSRTWSLPATASGQRARTSASTRSRAGPRPVSATPRRSSSSTCPEVGSPRRRAHASAGGGAVRRAPALAMTTSAIAVASRASRP
jgi:hypothetical protein